MIKEKNKIESIVIVKNNYGFIATLRFNDKKFDKIISSNSKLGVHKMIDKHVERALNGTI